MNVVKEINSINEKELELGSKGSWHDEYKDSAYIFVGGLPFGLTEGDLITIFSQYGEIMDVNMPRDKETGKTRGFGFVMYEDQRSTILAVDNLNGGKVIDRTIRVDHVKNYKQAKVKGEDGEMIEREEESFNARPELIHGDVSEDESVSTAPSIDPEDPMRDYLLAKRKEEKSKSKKKGSGGGSKRKPADETPEERRIRKEKKRAKKDARAARAVASGGHDRDHSRDRDREPLPRHSRRYSPPSEEGGPSRHPPDPERRERYETRPRDPSDRKERRPEGGERSRRDYDDDDDGYRRGGSGSAYDRDRRR